MRFVIYITMVFSFAMLLVLVTSENLYAQFVPSVPDRTNVSPTISVAGNDESPVQSNTVNGADNRLQNCAQTDAGKENDQSMECQQNVQPDQQAPSAPKQKLEVRTVERIGEPVGPGESVVITATCDPGEVATGGGGGWGFETSSDSERVGPTLDYILPVTNGMGFALVNAPVGVTDQNLVPAVSVYCAKLVDDTIILPTP